MIGQERAEGKYLDVVRGDFATSIVLITNFK